MWGPEDRLLVGISGGPDSVALASLVMESGIPFGLAHVNYRLRGEDSEADEVLVRHLAETWGVPLEIGRPDINALAEARGESIQQAARHWRYAWWQALMQRHGYTRILTGHQADDQAETLLLYLMRGGSRAGFQTIPYRRGAVCRPLLDLGREDLLAYLDARDLPWREDKSNRETDYQRNAIRHDLLPVMERLSPGIRARLARLAARQEALLAAADLTLGSQRPRFMEEGSERISLDLHRLQREPWCLAALFAWLQPLGFHGERIQAINDLDPASTGQRFENPEWVLVHNRGRLLGERHPPAEPAPIILRSPGESAGTPWGRLEVTGPLALPDSWAQTEEVILADASTVHWPLTLRPWAAGDRFVPLGMKGRKKVKDLLIDRKRDAFRKSRTLVVCDARGDIIWVVGEQSAEGIRIGTGTRQVYRLCWDPA